MAKQDEILYLSRQPAEGVRFAAEKPYSDPHCGKYLVAVGNILSLLPPRPARVLDLGCGTGWTSRFFAMAGYRTVGVDIAPQMIEIARERHGDLPNLSYRVEDYENLDFREEFDAVVFFDSLHHAEDERLALRKAYEALRPGGVALTSEPAEGHHEAAHSQEAVRHYGVTEKDMPPAKIVSLGREVGFRTFRVFPQSYSLNDILYAQQRDKTSPDPFNPAPARGTGLMNRFRRLFGINQLDKAYGAILGEVLDRLKKDGLVMLKK